jgi:hypothetical protein
MQQQGQRDQQGQREQRGQKEQTTQGKDRDMDKSQRGQRDQKEKATQGKDRDMDKAQRGQRDQTTGQTPREGQREQGQTGQRDRDQSPKQGQRDQQDRRDQQGQAKQDREGGGKTTLTSEQRTKIRTTVLNSGPRVSNVNFSVSVGTVVPTSVRVVAVPDVLIDIHPEWRGFMYFIVGDRIIIVDRSHRIVAILEV